MNAPGALLERVYRERRCELLRALKNRTHSRDKAQELLQEASLKTLLKCKLLDFEEFTAYLYRVAVNLAIDYERRGVIERRQRERDFNFKGAHAAAETVASDEERLRIVQEAITELPPRCRFAFELYTSGDFTFKQVGAEMGVTERMAQRHLARAFEYLSHRLGD